MATPRDYRPLHPGMGSAVAERTYLRKKENGDWETWGDVADRVALGNSLLCKDARNQKKEEKILRRHIANGSLLLSGRHLQHGDENQPKRNLEIYTNCSTSASSFVLFYLLLNGSGVGRCYDDDMMLVNWDYAPSVRCVIDHEHPDFDWSAHESLRDAKHKYGSGRDIMWFEVPDSREGWAKALEIWENAAFEKIHASKLLILDFSKVRAKGSPIGGMQNRPSSGPVPLMNAFHKAATLKGAGLERWRQALYIDHYFAECVLVGGARRCLPKGTIVTLKNGAKKIEDIIVGDSVVTPKGEKQVTAVFDQGIQQTVLIRHAFGDFECTPNHRVAVFNSLHGWEFKQAQDVKTGDRLVFDSAGWDYNEETYLPKHNLSESNTSRFNTTGTSLIIPELDLGVAWLVGLIQGDGYVEKTKDNHGRIRIGIHLNDRLVAEKAAKELDRFGGTTSIKPVKGENRWEVICHGVQLADYFLMHVKRPNIPLNVPEFISHGTREIRWAFLAGLFDADGSSKTRPINMVVTIYPEFAKQIQLMLLSLGVLSHSRVIVPKQQNWKPKTYINIKSMENINLVRTKMRESVTFSYDVKHSSGGFSFITESIRTEASINTAIAPNKTVPISRISNKTDIHFDAYPVPVHDVVQSDRAVQTYDIEVDDIHQFTANGFVVHNSARMSTKSWRDKSVLDFITVKRPIEYDGLNMEEIVELRDNNPFPPTGFLWSSNNSVTADAEFWRLVNLKRNEKGFHDEIAQHARRVMRKLAEASYADGTGEPGIINVDKLVQKEEGWEVLTAGDYVGSEKYRLEEDTELYMSRLARKAKRKKYCMITNPCLTADTLVYVADGRTSVSIGDLAKEGKDVPVFCLNTDGDVTVRTMRNPRVTGYDKKILKVTLDNGQSLRVTENHKFLLRGKEEYVRADALQPGDSLFVVNRYEPDNSSESRGHQYVCIGHSANSLQWEHVEVASFHHAAGNSLKGHHVHHLNENKSDNRPENLEIRIGTEHLSEHSMESDNPNYSGYTHDQILEFATVATKENGRRLSFKEWQAIAKEFGYPQTFSKWRDSHFNGVMGLLKQAALNAGLDPVVSRMDLDPRVIRSYQKMVSQGYDAEILDDYVVLNKNCECCGSPMKVNFLTPEVGLCSQSCKNKMRENNNAKHMQDKAIQTKALENRTKVLEERKSKTREQQIIVYNDIKFTLQREPTRTEFQSACKEKGVKPEIGRKTSPWQKWPELKEAAANHNHKVVSVEIDGYEDVYNGTVDEFHNFFVGGFEEITRNGRPKLVWVNNQNCGEIALTILGGYCTIADVVPFHADSLDEAEEAFRTAVRALIRVNTMDCLYNKEVKRTNRIGVGMTGVMEFAWRFFGYGFRDLIDEEKSKDFWLTLARFNQAVYDEAVSYSKELGVTVPHTMTTIKPSGCRPWNALTTTKQGILTLQELFSNHKIGEDWSLVNEQFDAIQDGKTNRVSKTYSNGKAEVLQIRLAYGLTIESTKNHPWFVKQFHHGHGVYEDINQWIPAENIQPGHVLDVKVGVYDNPEDKTLQEISMFSLRMRGTNIPIIQPKKMSPDLGWLFGYLWGDGAMSPTKFRLRWSDGNILNIEKAHRIILENFGVTGIIDRPNGKNCYELTVANKELWHWLIKNGVYKYFEDRIDLIPRIVRESSKETMLAFFAGLIDADGAIARSIDKTVMITNHDYAFCRHIQNVAWALGLALGLSHNSVGKNWQQERKEMYLLTASSATSLEAIDILVKHSNKMASANDDRKWRFDYEGREHRRVLGKVEKIVSLGEMETYDVEIENEHWFYAGAVRSHNTVSKLFGLCEGWHLPSMKWYVRWVQFRDDDPLIAKYRAAGYPVRELKQYRGHLIVGFPTQPVISSVMPEDKLVTAGEATPEEQYQWLMLGEKYWIHGTDTEGNPVTDRNIGNQISYCLAGDKNHLIPTTDGLQRIEDIKCSNTNDRFGLSQQIIDLVDNGIKKTVKAKLQNGVEIIGTKEHSLLTIDENLDFVWKTLGNLEAGDVIIRRVGDNQWSKTNVKLPGLGDLRIDGRMGNTNKVAVPIEVTPQFALFSGMLLSDGHVSINSIGITTVDHDVVELFSELLWNLFGLVSHTKFDSRTENVMRVEAHSRAISRWLKEIFPSTSDHSMNFIPACILQSRRECVEQFVKGYTLDGYVTAASGWVHICTTVSETMAKDLASVLFNLGFDAYIGHKAGRPYYFSEKNNGIGKDQYVVYLSRNDSLKFIEEIGFVETRKNNAMSVFNEATMPHKSSAIPATALMKHYQSNRDDYNGNENLRSIMKAGSSSISMQTVRREFSDLDIVKPIMDPNMRFTRVISVEDSGERHTYDITVDVSHEYVANSVVVHNTLKYLPEDVDYKGFKDMLIKYQSQIRCCSVMPQGDTSAYEYQPEQPINKAEYEKIAHAIQIALEEDIGKEHVDCDSGGCPIDFRSDADVKAA